VGDVEELAWVGRARQGAMVTRLHERAWATTPSVATASAIRSGEHAIKGSQWRVPQG
jgi:hypothetical protein